MFNVISSHSTRLLLCFLSPFHLSEASPVLTNWRGVAGFQTLCGSVITMFHVSCPCYLVSDLMTG